MKAILVALVLVSAFASPIPAQKTNEKAKSKIEQEIKGLMLAIDQAHQRGDAAAFDPIWADDYVLTDYRGIVKNRMQALAEWKAGIHNYQSYKSDEIRIHLYRDMAIVNARVTRKSRTEQENIGVFQQTRVFVKERGRWRLAATQVTPIAEQK